jgi:hypothetical protein
MNIMDEKLIPPGELPPSPATSQHQPTEITSGWRRLRIRAMSIMLLFYLVFLAHTRLGLCSSRSIFTNQVVVDSTLHTQEERKVPLEVHIMFGIP